jgi:transposase, IS5 family
LDWVKLEQIMGEICASKTGRSSYSLLTLLRALLLGTWYRLRDAELAQSMFRDLLFRKFSHLKLGENVPDATTIGHFWTRLMELGLWEVFLGEVNHQLETKHIIMTEGRINISMPLRLKRRSRGMAKTPMMNPRATRMGAGT